MDADSNAAAGRERSGGGDRLSTLGEGALGHILSFLPAAEAARAAALSRRWRHVFPAVHSLSFREAEHPLSMGYPWFQRCSYCGPDDARAPRLVTGVGSALHGRDRGPRAPGAPLRAFRVAFDEFGFRGGEATKAVDGWLLYAAYHAGDALEIDLRFGCEPVCGRNYRLLPPGHDAANGGGCDQAMDIDSPPRLSMDKYYTKYTTPKSLFSSATLRSLRLGRCWLDLPSAIALPSRDTLHLTRATADQSGAVQRLVSACPRLTDLTLEACSNLTELSVLDARLRRLALRCCHELAAVDVDPSELRAFEYRGAVPKPWFLTMNGPWKISLCTLDFCGDEPAGTPTHLMHFLRLFVGVERLHLTSARLGCGVGHAVFSSALKFPTFPALRNLELTGMLPEDDTAAITAVTGILEQTPSLETLSLFFLPEPLPVVTGSASYLNEHADEEAMHAAHKLRYDRHATLAVPGIHIPCLRERTREINLVHYQGAMAHRMLAKFLLGDAPVVTEVCCEFARGPLSIQTKLMEEIKGWVLNKSAKMMFF